MKEVRETKLVEQTTVRWFADDRKEFVSEALCRDYERRLTGDPVEKAYKRLRIAELEFPFQDWNGECFVDLVKLKSDDDYMTVIDYLEIVRRCSEIDCEKPENYPCLKVVVSDEYYANFAYENTPEGILKKCEKAMTIIEKAIIEINQ